MARGVLQAYLTLIVPLLTRYKCVTVPVLTSYTSVTATSRISDLDINIPNYCISRKDSIAIGQTGIAVYIHNSIADITHRRQDLESGRVECIWLELKPSTNAPNIFVCFFIQKPFCFL